MKRGFFALIVALLAVLAAGCTCMECNDLVVGTEYAVGDTYVDDGITVEVERFQYANGTWTEDGKARIDDRNYAFRGSPDINCRNVNLHFLFAYPKNEITLHFGDTGGTTNIEINGEFRNLGRLHEVGGTTIDDVTITVEAEQWPQNDHNWKGKITFAGEITDFKIGGQEIWIDSICQ